MKKKTNKLVSDWVLPVIGIGSLIFAIIISKRLDFIPDISFCTSYPNIFCKLPWIRYLFFAISSKFLAGLLIYVAIVVPAYLIFIRLGFKESNVEYKETKADKKKWDQYGIYVAVIFLPLYILFLIFYAD